jgi:hypothetical protein
MASFDTKGSDTLRKTNIGVTLDRNRSIARSTYPSTTGFMSILMYGPAVA